MKAIYIEWKDAESQNEWTSADDITDHLPLIKTFGLFIKKTSNCYLVALNHDSENQNYSCIMKIPKMWVTTVRFVEIP